jgi:tetratricopeptide (TPR) repeat protein
MDIFKTLTPEAMVSALSKQMEHIIAHGSDDVVRLRKELEKAPDDAELWFELGLSLNQAGLQYQDLAVRLAGLRYDMEHPEENQPEGEEVTLQVDVSAGRPLYQDSLAAFDKVLELNPDYYGVACQKGVVYGNMRDLENAEQCYLKALEDDDEDFTAAYYLSMVYSEMGKDDLAEKYQKISEELNLATE